MDQKTVQTHRNDVTPDLQPDGKPSEKQITAERSLAFTLAVSGLGVPRQIQRFMWMIYTITKAGQYYQFNDYQLGEYLGCDASAVSRNYVSALRRKLRDWQNSSYNDHGLKHYTFVSIQENNYDPKTKKQNPTGYQFSAEFATAIDEIILKCRDHRDYGRNWIRAMRETVATSGTDELSAFGFYNYRRERRPRAIEDILGTLLLNYKRLTREIIKVAANVGINPKWVADELMVLGPSYAMLMKDNATFLGQFGEHASISLPCDAPELEPHILRDSETGNEIINFSVQKTKREFQTIWKKAFAYASERERKEETVFAKPAELPFKRMTPELFLHLRKNRSGQDDSDFKEQNPNYAERRGNGQLAGEGANGNYSGRGVRVLPDELIENPLDTERLRYLQSLQQMERDDGGPVG